MDERRLEEIDRRVAHLRVFRVANPGPGYDAMLASMGLSEEDARELIELVSPQVPSPRGRFRRTRYGPYGFGAPSRYSDGTFPVLYSAEDIETARREKAHQLMLRAKADGLPRISEVHQEFSFQYSGDTLNLVSLGWPELTDNNHAFCQRLGRWAADQEVSGLRAPSARRPDGVCVPILSERSVRDEVDASSGVRITVDVASEATAFDPIETRLS